MDVGDCQRLNECNHKEATIEVHFCWLNAEGNVKIKKKWGEGAGRVCPKIVDFFLLRSLGLNYN